MQEVVLTSAALKAFDHVLLLKLVTTTHFSPLHRLIESLLVKDQRAIIMIAARLVITLKRTVVLTTVLAKFFQPLLLLLKGETRAAAIIVTLPNLANLVQLLP